MPSSYEDGGRCRRPHMMTASYEDGGEIYISLKKRDNLLYVPSVVIGLRPNSVGFIMHGLLSIQHFLMASKALSKPKFKRFKSLNE